MNLKKLKQLLFIAFLAAVGLASIHYLLIKFALPELYANFNVVYIYLFLTGLSLLGIWVIYLIQRNDTSLIGKGFMAFIVIKLFASLGFLLPFLLNQDETTRPFIYQFFAVFFPILFVETLLILQFVKFAELEKTQKDENP